MGTPVRRRHPILVGLLLALVLGTLGVAAVATIGFCTLIGCSMFPEHFDPQGEQATVARASATVAVGAFADQLVAGRPVLAAATSDICHTGQRNFKVSDSWAHECTASDSRVVVVTTDLAAVGDRLTAADAALRSLGCVPTLRVGGLEEVRGSWEGPDGTPHPEYGFMSSGPYGCPGGLTVQPEAMSVDGAQDALGLGVMPADDVLALDWFTPADSSALQRSGAQLALQLTVRQPYYRTRF